MKTLRFYSQLITFAVIAFFLHSCAVNPVTGKKQLMLVSEEQEKAMGLQYNPQIVATMGLYEDEQLQRFIDEKGNTMAKVSHRPQLNYKFQIVDSPVVNAFAVPGGFVYFTRGIMAHFNSEAEFMGVLGHELGHITARHSVAQQSKQTLGQVLLIGGMIAVPELQQFGELASQGMQLLFLKFSRDDESQSDQLGVEYSTRVGYDARHMSDFFSVLKRKQMKDNPQGIPSFLSTHPDPANRHDRVAVAAQEWKTKLGNKNYKEGRNSYLRMIDGLIFGENPRNGYVENNTFYHPEMRFQFPVPMGWKLVNQPSQVKMGAPDGKAMALFTIAGKGDLATQAQAALDTLKLQVRENKKVTVNGMPALAVISSQMGRNQQGRAVEGLRVYSMFIKDSNYVYAFHGVSQPENFNRYFGVFDNTFSRFAQLRDYSKINKKPDRIRVKTVPRTTTVQQALLSLGVKQKDLNDIAILNNMYLKDRIEAGTLIKVVGK